MYCLKFLNRIQKNLLFSAFNAADNCSSKPTSGPYLAAFILKMEIVFLRKKGVVGGGGVVFPDRLQALPQASFLQQQHFSETF
jgi:hypothetical protein